MGRGAHVQDHNVRVPIDIPRPHCGGYLSYNCYRLAKDTDFNLMGRLGARPQMLFPSRKLGGHELFHPTFRD